MRLKRLLLPPTRLLIARQAIQAIEAEARKHAQTGGTGHETGGVLIGRRLSGNDSANTILIAGATGPGANARTLPTEFEPDIEYVNQELAAWHERFPRLDYIGTWHKHPRGFPTFSPGDVRTAHAAFADPSYKMDELINPIVLVEGGHVEIYLFYMSRKMAEAGEAFSPLSWDIVTLIDDDEPVLDRERWVSGAPVPPAEAAPPWLSEEQRQLQAGGYTVVIQRDPERAQHFYFVVTHPELPETTVYFETPSGYPSAAMTCYVEQNGEAVTLRLGWLHQLDRGPGALRQAADRIRADLGYGTAHSAAPADEPRPTPSVGLVSDRPAGRRAWPSLTSLALAAGLIVALAGGLLGLQSGRDGAAVTLTAAPSASATEAVIAVASIITSPAVTPGAELTAAASRVWAEVEALVGDPAAQSRQIETARALSIRSDPQGTPTGQRLYQARVAYARSLLDADPARALEVARLARAEAPDGSGDEAAELIGRLEERRRSQIAAAWQAYDAQKQADNLPAAIAELETIAGLAGLLPNPAEFAPPDFDERTPEAGLLLADHQIELAIKLQRAGDLGGAEAQYRAADSTLDRITLLGAAGERGDRKDELGQALDAALRANARGAELWARVNREEPINLRDPEVLDALNQLADLEGFGPAALNPRDPSSQSARVDILLQLAQAAAAPPRAPARSPAAAQPTPAPQPAPTDAEQPAPTAEPPASPFSLSISLLPEPEFEQLLGGPICEGCNAYLDLPPELSLEVIGPGVGDTYPQSGPIRLGVGPVVLKLIANGTALPAQEYSLTTQTGTYYRVSIRRA